MTFHFGPGGGAGSLNPATDFKKFNQPMRPSSQGFTTFSRSCYCHKAICAVAVYGKRSCPTCKQTTKTMNHITHPCAPSADSYTITLTTKWVPESPPKNTELTWSHTKRPQILQMTPHGCTTRLHKGEEIRKCFWNQPSHSVLTSISPSLSAWRS